MNGIARKIDHVLLRVQGAQRAFDGLTGLGLPVAWPPFEYRGFLSAAVSFGNANLELLEPVDPANPFATDPETRIIGIAFEPWSIDDCVQRLDAAGIAHREPWDFEFRLPGGPVVASWTNVDLEPWPSLPVGLFVKYNRDQDERWTAFSGALSATDGGPAGIVKMAVLHVPAEPDGDSWRALLPEPAAIPIPGPRLQTAGRPGAATTLEIEVRSGARAIEAFRQAGFQVRESNAGCDVLFGGEERPCLVLREPTASSAR